MSSEDPIAKREGVGLPLLGHDPPLQLGVEMHDIGHLPLWDVIVFEVELDQLVGDRPICISQVKPGEMHRLPLVLGILDDLTDDLDMLDATVDTLDEGLLGRLVDVVVLRHEAGHPVCLQLVVDLAQS